MSNISPPNYTQAPNVIFDLMPEMKEAELRITLVIIRKTFGWHSESAKLSIAQLMKATGLSRQGVINGITAGIERGTIERQSDGDGFVYNLAVNEVDNTSQRSRRGAVNVVDAPPVNVVERELVNVVDDNKETYKETKPKKGVKEKEPTNQPVVSSLIGDVRLVGLAEQPQQPAEDPVEEDPNSVQATAVPPSSDAPPTPAAERMVLALLTDPEVVATARDPARHEATVRAWLATRDAGWLLRHLAVWWADYQAGVVESFGALASRIDRDCTPNEWPAEFTASELYARHYPVPRARLAEWVEWQKTKHLAGRVIGIDKPAWLDVWLEVLPVGVRELLDMLPLPEVGL